MNQILPVEVQLKDYIENIGMKPSRVLVLLNMVSPKDIDVYLEDEVVEECENYGKVLKSIIYLQPNTGDDESVRIFVLFERYYNKLALIVKK
mmetsp:Transcript_7535/g.1014  ORF Transcript_7535/g.1014 Transcript_7535/m.1014 type:complete len:92 (+) Transcript_7535:235-510(+)